MLDDNIRRQLGEALARMTEPVELVLSCDDDAPGRAMSELVGEVAGLGDLVTVVEGDEAVRPTVAVRRVGEEARTRFRGAPGGHELTSFVLAVLWAGGVAPAVDAGVLERAARLELVDAHRELTTYVSLSCVNCPETVQALNLVAVTNPGLSHTVVDGAVFRDQAEAAGVLSVPTVVDGDGALLGSGRMTVVEVLEVLGEVDGDGAVDREPYDVLVVGGGPAAAAAVVYAARKGVRVGLVAERLGGQVGDTVGIENLVSVPYTEGPRLVSEMAANVRAHDVEMLEGLRASALVPAARVGGLHTVELDGRGELRARTVVVATGARWRTLGVPGEEEMRNRGVTFCPHCDGPVFTGRPVVVVGGGNSGAEAAIDLAGLASSVMLVEYADELRCDQVLADRLEVLGNVEVQCGTETVEVLGEAGRVAGLAVRDRGDTSGASMRTLDVEGVFVQIGLVPNTAWLEGAVELARGEVVVDDRCATSVPGVFAAGDCTTVPYKQIVISMGQGATAALSAFDHLVRTAGAATDAATGATAVRP